MLAAESNTRGTNLRGINSKSSLIFDKASDAGTKCVSTYRQWLLTGQKGDKGSYDPLIVDVLISAKRSSLSVLVVQECSSVVG